MKLKALFAGAALWLAVSMIATVVPATAQSQSDLETQFSATCGANPGTPFCVAMRQQLDQMAQQQNGAPPPDPAQSQAETLRMEAQTLEAIQAQAAQTAAADRAAEEAGAARRGATQQGQSQGGANNARDPSCGTGPNATCE